MKITKRDGLFAPAGGASLCTGAILLTLCGGGGAWAEPAVNIAVPSSASLTVMDEGSRVSTAVSVPAPDTATVISPPSGGEGEKVQASNSYWFSFLRVAKIDGNWNDRQASPSRVGGYTRIYIEEVGVPPKSGSTSESDPPSKPPVEETGSHYIDEKDSWGYRLFIKKNQDRILNLKVSISSPMVSRSTTLAISNHSQSNEQGENWLTFVNKRKYVTAYFRLDADTNAAIDASLRATSNVGTSEISVNLIEQAGDLISPLGKLVTGLKKGKLASSANFVDSAIKGLFDEKIEETSTIEYNLPQLLAYYSPAEKYELAKIEAYFPQNIKDSGSWSPKKTAIHQIGVWSVRFDPPIVSIFSDYQYCIFKDSRAADQSASSGNTQADNQTGTTPSACPSAIAQARNAFETISVWDILNFPLDENTTLYERIKGLSGFTESVNALNGSNNGGASEGASTEGGATAATANTSETSVVPAKKKSEAASSASVPAAEAGKPKPQATAGAGEDTTLPGIERSPRATVSSAMPVKPQGAKGAKSQLLAAKTLCALIDGEVGIQGFNRFDRAAAVWAVSESGALNEAAKALLMDKQNCPAAKIAKAIIPALNGDRELENFLKEDQMAAENQASETSGTPRPRKTGASDTGTN